MAQLVSDCESRAQSTVFTDRTASVRIANGTQFSEAYSKGGEKRKEGFKIALKSNYGVE